MTHLQLISDLKLLCYYYYKDRAAYQLYWYSDDQLPNISSCSSAFCKTLYYEYLSTNKHFGRALWNYCLLLVSCHNLLTWINWNSQIILCNQVDIKEPTATPRIVNGDYKSAF